MVTVVCKFVQINFSNAKTTIQTPQSVDPWGWSVKKPWICYTNLNFNWNFSIRLSLFGNYRAVEILVIRTNTIEFPSKFSNKRR